MIRLTLIYAVAGVLFYSVLAMGWSAELAALSTIFPKP